MKRLIACAVVLGAAADLDNLWMAGRSIGGERHRSPHYHKKVPKA